MKQLLNLILSFTIILMFNSGCTSDDTTKSPYDYVNPFIGTGGHGHTYPGATMAFGMVQLSPDSRLDGWDGCSGYHYTDSIIYGFSHTHLSGTGVSDYGDILLMPFNSDHDLSYKQVVNRDITPSLFSKETEKASPGYYGVTLEDANVELTVTERTGIHQYQFLKEENNQVLLDLNHRDKVLDFKIKIIDDRTISGYRISSAWAEKQHVYFFMQFSEPFEAYLPTDTVKQNDYYRILKFKPSANTLTIKVAISSVSEENAKENLETEAPHWDFDRYKNDAKQKWTEALSKIEVEDKNEDKLSIFYTSLYHTMIVPNVFSDINGEYRGMDGEVHTVNKGKKQYTIFSLWDTFRGTHPLYSIIEQERTSAFIQTFLNQFEQGGRLPVWELSGNETDCMIGYHSVPVITDAFIKGITDFDSDLALNACIHSAELDHLGLSAYKKKGFIASGDEAESVSKTLEYAYDDWCIAQLAKAVGNDSMYNEYIIRSQNYKNLFNPENGFMQAKMNGGFTSGFNPAEVNFNFTEANAWQYSLFAPHDIQGLINLHGSDTAFEHHLDELFSTDMSLSGRHQVDITGLIGQYAHGNEPSHHMAYLYNYLGKAHKTQAMVHKILTEQYQNKPDGLSGNEDCGQMSAWYALSSMGFYSVTPGTDYYTIGTPHLTSAKIHLENGNTFCIKANNLTPQNFYIQSATLNGEKYDKSFIAHSDIMKGGELIFEMGHTPNPNWGNNNLPVSSIPKNDHICATPFIKAASQTFSDSLSIQIGSANKNCKLYYSINDQPFTEYEKSVLIKKDATIKAYAIDGNNKSNTVSGSYKKIEGGRRIEIESEYSNQYSAGGQNALIDYLRGSTNYRTGYWQGYQGQDVTVVVDLEKVRSINSIGIGALQDIKSWIWYPSKVDIWTSLNKVEYKEYARIHNDFPVDQYSSFIKDFKFSKKDKARYIKLRLKYPGNCPDWHLGKGGKSWIFVDEILIE